MSEIDRVFSRFVENKPAAGERREVRNIPRKGSSPGSRVVEVVHLRSGAAPADKERPRRTEARLRATTWEDGFRARQASLPAPPPDAPKAPPASPTTHVMPAWEPTAPEQEAPAIAAPHPQAAAPRGPGRPRGGRRIADPFDAADDAANCMRCGYVVEPAREKRGLMTCGACG